jgi:hypothetical protein
MSEQAQVHFGSLPADLGHAPASPEHLNNLTFPNGPETAASRQYRTMIDHQIAETMAVQRTYNLLRASTHPSNRSRFLGEPIERPL